MNKKSHVVHAQRGLNTIPNSYQAMLKSGLCQQVERLRWVYSELTDLVMAVFEALS